MSEFAPCPFCGFGSPIELWDSFDGGWIAHMHCPSCGANGPEPSPPRATAQAAINDCIAAWNRRASQTTLPQG